jgi:Fur family ferric uptake transcriptional regulator
MAAKRLQKERDLFYEYLRRNKMKRTHQKDLILEVFLSNEGHLSIEDIYTLAKKRDRKIGIVTVFRTLKSLTACSIAKEISLGDGLTRFEHCFCHPIHHHMICTQCHGVIEYLSPELERLQRAIVEKYHFLPSCQHIQIEGICRECSDCLPKTAPVRMDTDKIFARDALKLALAIKNNALKFYQSAAALNQDSSGRAVFEATAQTEQTRIRELEHELDLLHQQEKGLEKVPAMLHVDDADIRKLIPSLIGSEIMFDACCVKAMTSRLESESAALFREYAGHFGDCNGKRIFQRLAEPEAPSA